MTDLTIRRIDSGESPISVPTLPAASGVQTRTILIAEDDRVLRTSLELGLSYRGFRVLAASDGSEAFEIFRQAAPSISLVLSDVNMPVLDGPQLLNSLRAMTPAVRLCFMTGDGRPRNLARLRSLGAVHAFAKPFPSVAILADELWQICTVPLDPEDGGRIGEPTASAQSQISSEDAPPVRPSVARKWNAFLRTAIADALPTLHRAMAPTRSVE